MESSSERIAQEFMREGRPAPEPLQDKGVRPGDVSMGLEIKTPQPGAGFKEWALKGFDKDGGAKSGPVAPDNHDVKPGQPADVKATIPAIVKNQ